MVTQRIKNSLLVEVDEGVDFTTSTNIEFYIKQNGTFIECTVGNENGRTITVVSSKKIIVTIPKSDAMKLLPNYPLRVQFALTDTYGNPVSSEDLFIHVDDFIKVSGYGS